MPDTTTRIPAVGITLHRAEGPTGQLGDAEFTGPDCWSRAAAQLRTWGQTAPRERDAGVDKTDFTVTFADGEIYHGCFGLTFHTDGDLGAHMRRVLSWCVDPARVALLGDPAPYQQLLDGYQLGT